jgi:4-hydroxybenzoate polyprenyltransferase
VARARVAVVLACALFVAAAWRLNPLCLALSPVALAWVLAYSYTKRFTAWSHLVLGAGLGIAPVGGYLAVTGAWPAPWWGLVALAGAVMTWVAGFDVLYALQDADFDRREGLRSIPARLGEPAAIAVVRALHAASVALLALSGIAFTATLGWSIGVAVVAALLLWEHRLVRVGDLTRLDAAFFTMNGVISLVFCGIVLTERVLA